MFMSSIWCIKPCRNLIKPCRKRREHKPGAKHEFWFCYFSSKKSQALLLYKSEVHNTFPSRRLFVNNQLSILMSASVFPQKRKKGKKIRYTPSFYSHMFSLFFQEITHSKRNPVMRKNAWMFPNIFRRGNIRTILDSQFSVPYAFDLTFTLNRCWKTENSIFNEKVSCKGFGKWDYSGKKPLDEKLLYFIATLPLQSWNAEKKSYFS